MRTRGRLVGWHKAAAILGAMAIALGLAAVPAAPASAVSTTFQCIPGAQGLGYSYGNNAKSLLAGTLYLPSTGVKKKLALGPGAIDWKGLSAQLDDDGVRWLFSLKWMESLVLYYDEGYFFGPGKESFARAKEIVIDFNAAYPDQAVKEVWHPWVAAFRTEAIACLARDVSSDSPILDILQSHAEFQATASHYLGNWNQGLEQDVALLAASCVLGRPDWETIANTRAAVNLDASFSPDGSMNEQAPGYFVWAFKRWVVYLDISRQCSNAGLPELDTRLRNALQFLQDSIRPDGNLVPIGDTVAAPPAMSISNAITTLGWTPTRDTAASPSNSIIANYPDGGFLFSRTSTGAGAKEQYTTLRYGPRRYGHGHYDHGSVTWWSKGHPVLIDGGYNGYVTTGMREAFQSPQAHNVLTLPAVPFRTYSSSTLTRSTVTDKGWFYEVSDAQTTAANVMVGGGYQGATRIRGVLTVPAAGIMVAYDRVDRTHLRYMFKAQAAKSVRWWHLDKSFTATVSSRSTVTAVAGTTQVSVVNVAFPEAPLTLGSTTVVKGSMNPIQGWMGNGAGQLYAAPAIGMTSLASRMLSVVVDTTKGTVVTTKLIAVGKGWALSIKVGTATTVVAIAPSGAMSVG